MYTLAQRLSSNWSVIGSLLSIGLTFVAGLVWWVMQPGGKQRLLSWIVEIESSEQEDAAQRITRGLNAFQEHGGASTACFDFIGGLDQWRAVQNRIEQRCIRVHRSGYPICLFAAFAVAAFIVHIFEPPASTWSAWCVAGATIAFAWLLWNIFPLGYMAWLNGLPHSPPDTTPRIPANNSASPATNTPPQSGPSER